MNEVNLPAIEPVTDEDVAACINYGSRAQIRAILLKDRRRVAQRQAERPLEKINCDESYGRSYIPVAPGWEVQTKGKGSTFRLCEPSGDRLAVPDSPYLHATIERMALAIHAHRVAMEEEIERLRAEVAAHRKHDVLRCDALMKAEAEVAKLNAACAAKDAALIKARADLREVGNDYPGSSCYEWCHARANEITAALSPDAGRNWIDATGAVEATCFSYCEVVGRAPFETYRDVGRVEVPKEWTGSRAVIVRMGK